VTPTITPERREQLVRALAAAIVKTYLADEARNERRTA
jgi:hypothetical protein